MLKPKEKRSKDNIEPLPNKTLSKENKVDESKKNQKRSFLWFYEQHRESLLPKGKKIQICP
jgi:hypothetical protein